MTKTDNEKYVKRGAGMFIEHIQSGRARSATQTKAGAPYGTRRR